MMNMLRAALRSPSSSSMGSCLLRPLMAAGRRFSSAAAGAAGRKESLSAGGIDPRRFGPGFYATTFVVGYLGWTVGGLDAFNKDYFPEFSEWLEQIKQDEEKMDAKEREFMLDKEAKSS